MMQLKNIANLHNLKKNWLNPSFGFEIVAILLIKAILIFILWSLFFKTNDEPKKISTDDFAVTILGDRKKTNDR